MYETESFVDVRIKGAIEIASSGDISRRNFGSQVGEESEPARSRALPERFVA